MLLGGTVLWEAGRRGEGEQTSGPSSSSGHWALHSRSSHISQQCWSQGGWQRRPAIQASGVGRPFRTLHLLPGLCHSVNRWPQASSFSSFSLLPSLCMIICWGGGRVLSNVLHAPAELLALQFLLTLLHAQAHLISSCTSEALGPLHLEWK